MDIEILSERENPLLKRREIVLKVIHGEGSTPTRRSVLERLAAIKDSKPGLVVIRKMNSLFGKRESIAHARIYESEERMRQVENPHIVKRNVLSEQKEAS
ncbi:30S ribosomal protein S24e [Methanothrix sp.]|uniref:30S ribosomal protein S24e n=1 Tax=Methanothrix sp. TaxID=90426 RepID=UPI0031677064|nr:30S ribosomal protein S24e [Methanothrix sp.]